MKLLSLPYVFKFFMSTLCWLFIFHGCVQTNELFQQDGVQKNNQHHHTGSCTIHTVKNGKWSQKKTWNHNRLPEANETICINHRVVYDQTAQQSVDLRSVTITDKLVFAVNQSTQLRVQDLYVMHDGLLRIGQQDNPLADEYLAEIVFVHQAFPPQQNRHSSHGLGLIAMGGQVELHGRQVDRILRFDLDWNKNQADYDGQQVKDIHKTMQRASWKTNDEILFPAQTFRRNQKLGNETRHLQSLSAQRIQLDQPLNHSHKRIHQENLYLANLSANIILRSAKPNQAKQRGHVMFMKGSEDRCGHVNISGVRFEQLGRTDKRKITSNKNPQMMYALHFHRCDAPQDRESHLVRNSVVVNTPGWGLVNHGSDVIFHGNVVYDFKGAGFVAEAGNERGEFSDNLSVGGDGLRQYDFRRLYLGQEDRIQEADLGFHGDGFWISSPFVKVEYNASIGNHGNGFVWYITGIDARFVGRNIDREHLSLTVPASFFTTDELKQIGYGEPRRAWSGKKGQFLVSDLPIFQPVVGNYAAANFVGLRTRYARSLNLAFLNKFWAPHQTEDFIEGIKDISGRSDLYIPYSQFNHTVLQNNEIGLHTSYSTRVHFKELRIEADQSLKSTPTPNGNEFEQNETTGIEMNHTSNGKNRLENVVVRGYEVGERRSPKDGPVEHINVQYRNCDTDTITWDVQDIREQRR